MTGVIDRHANIAWSGCAADRLCARTLGKLSKENLVASRKEI